MGLDMYIFQLPKNELENVEGGDFDCTLPYGTYIEIAYWRKFNQLHGWMERLYRERGGKEQMFNGILLRLHYEDIIRLDKEKYDLEYTPGFFFGGEEIQDYHMEELERFIRVGRVLTKEGFGIFYDSSW